MVVTVIFALAGYFLAGAAVATLLMKYNHGEASIGEELRLDAAFCGMCVVIWPVILLMLGVQLLADTLHAFCGKIANSLRIDKKKST